MKILIADDNPLDIFMLTKHLEQWDYQVVSCTNGKDALEILSQEDAPKLAILDWVMPGMTGEEVCQELRFQDPDDYLYILIVSSRTEREDIIRGLQSGADDYISKPPDPRELQARLRTGRRIIELQENLIAAREALRIQATQDFLTGIHNRAAIMAILHQEINRSTRTHSPMGILMADIDFFKHVNDTFGHPAGDAVIKEVAARIQQTLREYDAVGRFGGEEFLVIASEIKADDFLHLAERIRCCIADTPIAIPDSEVTVTMSFGGAVLNTEDPCTDDELIAQADLALYRAKEGGRNQVDIAPQKTP